MYGEDWVKHYEQLERELKERDQAIQQVRAKDTQVAGNHYRHYPIQPVEFAMANELNLCQANVVKYIVRHKDKGGKEDLLKARHYIDLLIEYEYDTDDAAAVDYTQRSLDASASLGLGYANRTGLSV